MKRLLIIVAAAGIAVVLIGAFFLWQVFGPSVIVIRNVGDQSARLILTDADRSTEVWSGSLGPGRRKTVMAWFKHEGSPELRCRDQVSSDTAKLEYVTGYMPIGADIEIAGCNNIRPNRS